jgi:hypothetical protein
MKTVGTIGYGAAYYNAAGSNADEAAGLRAGRSRVTLRHLALPIAIATALLYPDIADACAVCYGAEDSAMTAGLNNGILALLGVIAVVQGSFVALFVSIWQRGRRLRRRRTGLHLIQGGTG